MRTTTEQLAGTGTLLRLALRRDRLLIPLWALALGGSFASVARSLAALYETDAARAEFARSVAANGTVRALYGPVFADSVGGLTAWRMAGTGAALAGAMSLVIVVRHTREEEETGRQEMLSAAMVGRRAALTAGLLAALAANAALMLVIVAGMVNSGAGVAGSVALGAAVGGAGMVFAGTAAVAAQLTGNARLAKGLTAAALGAAFALKAVGDAAAGAGSSPVPTTWLSPMGWAEHVRAFGAERWWVLLLPVAAFALQAVVAYTLAGRRDLGMSFLPARPGPAAGALGTAGALALRLQRGGLAGWAGGFLLAGIAFGGLANGAAELVGDNEATRRIFERMGGQRGLTDAFLASMVGMLGMVAALFTVASVLRLHGEETAGRAEPLLASPVGRLRWAAGHLTIAFGGAALIMALGGVGLSIGYGHDPAGILGAALLRLPAIWLLGGLAVLLYGLTPSAAPTTTWAATGLALALGWLGPALNLPPWAMDLSPFDRLPKLPGGEMAWPPALIMTALAGALVAGGLAGLRRRDLRG
ncbi:ABC transporter permease [Streptomyces paludis]|uniref:ABC transporter permease n=1 Tax=Streptomyces paludis TaxID=2282738 RepID=A0A345I190_9ACTN|nr:ABC transporter permease [Streptomyces paludis]